MCKNTFIIIAYRLPDYFCFINMNKHDETTETPSIYQQSNTTAVMITDSNDFTTDRILFKFY